MKNILRYLTAAAGILTALSAHAQDRTWDGTTGSWDVPTNWSGDTLPTGSDEAWIDNGGTATLGAGVSGTTLRTMVGKDATGNLLISGGLLTTQSLYVGDNSTGIGVLTMTSGTILTNNTTAVGWNGNGTLNISGGLMNVGINTFYIGVNATATGVVNVSGGTMSLAGNFFRIGNSGTGTLNVSDGLVSAGAMVIGGEASGVGTLNLTGGVVETGRIAEGDGTGTINLNGGTLRAKTSEGNFLQDFEVGDVVINSGGAFIDSNGYNIGIATQLSGTGGLTKLGAGELTLSGTNAYEGATTVEAGTLLVNGVNSGTGAVSVESGATLGGSGVIAGSVVIADGAHLAPGTSPGTLTTGDLMLNGNSQLDFELDTPGVVGSGVNDLVEVNGDLVLDGILNITDLGGFGDGTYRLFNYSGGLTDNGLLFGIAPAPYDFTVATGSGEVNLLVAASTVQFWDGANTSPNGIVDGGTGTWNAAMANWTNTAGNANASWVGGLGAVFSGSAGTVTIANGFSADPSSLDFQTPGYTLEAAGSGNLAITGNTPFITVAGETIISAPIVGMGGVIKQGVGTLTLSGSNSYTGNTTLQNGVVQISSDANLGDSGDLIFQGGELRTTADFTIFRDAMLESASSVIRVNNNTILTYAGDMSGTGMLRKQGFGDLVLTGDAMHSGGTIIGGGSLQIGDGGTTGSIVGNITNNAELIFNRSDSFTFADVVSGTGNLVQQGNGLLRLTGVNTFTGTTMVNSGTLRVAQGGAITQTSGVFIADGAADEAQMIVNGASGGSVTSTGPVVVGNSGTGVLRVTNGGMLTTTAVDLDEGGLFLGSVAGSEGTLRVVDAGSLVALSGILEVGGDGDGIVRILDGGELRAVSMGLGIASGATGDVKVSGSGSLLDLNGDVFVGYEGTGELLIADGGTVTNNGLAFLGTLGENSMGTATVTGANSSWTVGDDLVVGAEGKGTLNILNGGSVVSNYGAFIGGTETAATGLATVSGSSSTWTIADFLSVGGEGTGTLNILDGARVTAAFTDIGSYPGDVGVVNVDGVGSVFEQTEDQLIIGFDGIGTLNLSNGGLLDQGGLSEPAAISVGRKAGSSGTINIGADPMAGPVGAGIIDAPAVRGRNGDATLNFNHTGTDYFFTSNGMSNGTAVAIRGSIKVGQYAGTTTINRQNNYTGGTTIGGGILRTTTTRSLGTGPVTLNAGTLDPGGTLRTGAFTWNGGTVASDLGTVTDLINVNGDLTLTAPGTFEFAAVTGFSNNTPYRIFNADNMGGFNPLTDFAGNALFTLDPVFSITGDNLFVNFVGTPIFAGTLLQNSAPVDVPFFADFRVTGPASTGTPTESNTIHGLIFDPNTSLLVFNTLTVTSGRFTVDGGTGTLAGGRVVTQGDFTKDGPGSLIVNNTVEVAGAANVLAGAMRVNGTFTTGGGLTVFQNALLGGSGMINGNVFNNGVVSPGNSPGTLTINGNYTQSGSGTLQIEYGDLLWVSGRASLAGTLQYLGGTKLKYGQQITFLQAGSISGDFDQILMPDSDRFRGRFLTDGGTGTLLVAPTSYTLVAQTTNQWNVAKALDSFISAKGNDRETVSIALDLQSEEQYPYAFDQIAPTFYESLGNITIEQAFAQTQQLNQRLSAVRLGVRGFQAIGIESPLMNDKDGKSVMEAKDAKSVVQTATSTNWNIWAMGNGMFGKITNVSQVPNYDFNSGGFLVGADYRWSENFSTGVYTGYQYTWADYGSAGNTQINSALFGGYATYDNEGFYADAVVGGGYNGYRVRRSIEFSTINRTARSTPNGGQLNAAVNLGYDWEIGKFTLGPIAGVQYTYAGIAPFTEDGADSLDLRVNQQNVNSIRSTLGARIAYTWNVTENIAIIPEIRMMWTHEFLNNPRNISSALDGGAGPTFGFETSAPARDSAFAGAGLTAQLGQNWNAFVFYNIDFGRQDYLGNYVSGGLGWKF